MFSRSFRIMNEQPIILLAEDTEDDVILIQRAFREARIRTPLIVVHDGEEAICYLAGLGRFGDRKQFPFPDLFLLDLKMPVRDGFEVLRWIRTKPELKKLPVIVLTQSDRIKDANQAYQLGAYSFLVKETDFKDTVVFAQSIADYLDRTRNNGHSRLPPGVWPAKETMGPNSGTPIYPEPQ